MLIKDHYESILDAVADKYVETPATTFQIGRNDSLHKAIGYTRRYVRSYRYHYYRRTLSGAFQQMGFDPTGCQVVHLDIGCGPGVFSWVLHDQMASRNAHLPDSVVYYGYDHCANMIGLAHLFLKGLPADPYEFHGYSDLAPIRTALERQNFSNCDVVVTFGYTLVQVQGDPYALKDFATLISCLFPSRSCIVVAADAKLEAFGQQCTALKDALNESGVGLEDCWVPYRRSVMVARLNME